MTTSARTEHGSVPLYGLFGTGRSGTTWLGSILNSHPQIVYRFEPFHRVLSDSRIGRLRELIDTDGIRKDTVEEIYAALLRAHPETEKAPFFPKSDHFTWGLSKLWPVARKAAAIRPLFEKLYTPSGTPPLVFKEVTMEPLLLQLLRHTPTRVVHLVRHPCGVVASVLEGQAKGMMPTGRLPILRALLRDHYPALAAEYGDRIERMSDCEKNAILWRFDAERSIEEAAENPNALLLLYEELCTDPLECSRLVFEHFGIPMHQQTEEFVRRSVRPDESPRWKRGELLIRDYFSVYRDPAESMNKWKSQLSRREQEQIVDIVRESPAFQRCARRGVWES